MLKNISVRLKLYILIAIPTLALILLSASNAWDKYKIEKAMSSITEIVDMAVSSGKLIHELQKERGFSAGFMGAKGAVFANEMRQQRDLTQKQRLALEEKITAFARAYPEDALNAAFRSAISGVSGLDRLRGRIDGLNIPASEIIAQYTSMIEELQTMLGRVLDKCNDVTLYDRTMALISFIKAKEFAGQERATLNAALSSGKFTNELYKGWVERVALQKNYLENFLDRVPPEPEKLYSGIVPPLLEKVEGFRRAALASLDQDRLEGNPKEWFSAATAYIDALHTVELDISDRLGALARQLRAESVRAFYVSIGIAGGVVVLMLLLTGLIVRDIAIPLRQAVGFARKVAEGDFNSDLEMDRKDDFGTLAVALKRMTDEIRDMIAKANDATESARQEAERARIAMREAEEAQKRAESARREGMQAAAAQLSDVVAALSEASRDISASIRQSDSGAREQSNRLGETATAMEEMNSTVLEVAKNSAHAAETADSARTQAKDGSLIVADVTKNISTVLVNTEELKTAMNRLGQRVQDIDKVLNVISDIADQTNLLALNAAIEAARAGDAGRGFAVVADEVRKLAEKTMNATKGVSQVLSGIQEDTAQNIATVDRTVEGMSETTELTRKSGEALEKIVELVDTTTDQIRSIATASEEQSATSEEINRSVEEVNRIALDTVDAMTHSTQGMDTLLKQTGILEKLIVDMQSGKTGNA